MAVGTVQIKGLDEILKNLNKQIASIEGDVMKGLILSGQLIKGVSMKNTPVYVGNLKGSHYLVAQTGLQESESGSFSTKDKSGQKVAAEHPGHVQEASARAQTARKPFVEIGCTAFYAEVVHEDLQARHTSGKAKFLEDAIKSMADKVISTIKRFAKR